MYQNCCTKCGSISLFIEKNGNNTGLYCSDCGAWIKWLGKDEIRAFEHSKEDNQTMDDSLYIELFAIKDGVRYNGKTIDMKEATTMLTNSLIDGIEKLWSNK